MPRLVAASISITSGVAGANLGAGIANAAGLGHRPFRRAAVHRHGQDAGDRRLADSAMTAEDIAVRDALLRDGILQGAGDVLLANNVGEFLRPVFARQNLVAHARPRLYSLRRVRLRAASFGRTGCPRSSRLAARSPTACVAESGGVGSCIESYCEYLEKKRQCNCE